MSRSPSAQRWINKPLSNKEARKRGKKTVWESRTLGRDVTCHKCNKTIAKGDKGYTKANEVDLTEWHHERCTRK
jgi:hypothetical protein